MPTETKKSIRPPTFIELEGLNELGRLVCALERTPLPLFALNYNGKNMIAAQLDLFMGTPIFYYAFSDQISHYLGYRTSSSGEEVALVDSPSNSSMVYAPIIELVRLPHTFEKGLKEIGSQRTGHPQKFLSLGVKDLLSLVKVASYKIMFEEPPLPIFAFPDGSEKWRIGSFTRIEDYEEASIFFYFEQDRRPDQNFVKYSMTKADAAYTNKTDEHGNFYVKVVRLKASHPLVELD